jgi:hypothetical protein
MKFSYQHRTGAAHGQRHAGAFSQQKLNGRPGWPAAGGGMSVACIVLPIVPRGRWRNTALGVRAVLAIAFTVAGCAGA